MSNWRSTKSDTEEAITIDHIESNWKKTRQGKNSLQGSQLHRLATMLNTSAFSLSSRLEALVQLARTKQGQQLSRHLLNQMDEIRKELSLCRDIGYFALCEMRKGQTQSHAAHDPNR